MTNAAIEHTTLDPAAMLDAIPDRMVRFRLDDLTITFCNAAWATLHEIDREAAVGRSLDEFLSDDARVGLHRQLLVLSPDHPIATDEEARSALHDPELWIEWIDRYVEGPEGPEVLAIGRDVTSRRAAELRLAASEARYRNLADNSFDIIWRIEEQPSRHFQYMSPSVERITGYPPEFFLNDFTRILEITDAPSRTAISMTFDRDRELRPFDIRLRHVDGSSVVCESQATRIGDGVQGVSRDVTELRHLQARLQTLASRDPLTGLPNRRLLAELLDDALLRTRDTGRCLAVAFIDLDGLKSVNDTYGHDAGDVVLRESARRLQHAVGQNDAVARVGGDEFVVVIETESGRSTQITELIERALAVPVELEDGVFVTISGSIGVADTKHAGESAAHLIAVADQAMYEVKRQRQSRHAG